MTRVAKMTLWGATLLGATLLAAAPMPAHASQAVSQEQKDKALERLDELKARLQLTPEQLEQIRPILTDEMTQLKAVRDKHSGDGQSRRARLSMARDLRDIQRKTDDQLKKILSKSQMDEMKKIREERRQQLRSRAGQSPRH